jgi:hypothetical protein
MPGCRHGRCCRARQPGIGRPQGRVRTPINRK